MRGILQDLASKDVYKRRESLQSLQTLSRMHSSSLPLPHLSSLVRELADCLYDPDREVSSLTLDILQDLFSVLFTQKSTEDLGLDHANVFAGLLHKTADQRFEGRARDCVVAYAKFGGNPAVVVSEVYYQGVCNEDVTLTQPRIRFKSLELFLPVINAFPGFSYHEDEMLTMIKHLAASLQDPVAEVAETARRQLKLCESGVPVFGEVLGRLKSEDRRRVDEALRPREQGVEEEKKEERWERPSNVPLQSEAMRTFSDSFTSGLEFGFLPSRLLPRLLDKENWKDRISALSEAQTCLKALDSLQTVLPHAHKLLALVDEWIQDKNLKICTSGVEILEYLLTYIGLSLHADLVPVAAQCIQRLGDNKIVVRQACFRCLRKLLKELRLAKLLPSLLDGLKAANWHLREESLNVLLAAMLVPDLVHDVDFLELVPAITPLVDDEKPKVRYVAQEALSVLSHVCGKSRVLTELQPLLDPLTLDSLQEKFSRKSVPIVREDSIEFPRSVPASAPLALAVLGESPEREEVGERKRRLRSALRRKEEELFPMKPEEGKEGAGFSLPLAFPEMSASTPPLFASSLRISKRRVIRHPTFQEQASDVLDSPLPAAPLAADLTPVSGSKLKDNARVNATQTPVKALVSHDPVSEAPVYVRTEDLRPPDNPMEDFHRMIRKMQSGNWAEQCEALNICRGLMKFSSEVFKCVNVHEIVFQVLMLADSLRSSLSKSALMALADMCQFLTHFVEPDMDTVTSLLLRKAVDTNVFISEAAGKAIIAMCQYCAEGKVVNAILANLAGARSSLVKAKSAFCFEQLFLRLDSRLSRLRELDRVLKKLAEFSTEASPDVRGCAKSALRALANSFQGSGELDKLLFRSLNSDEYKQVKTFMTQTVVVRTNRVVRLRAQSSLMDPLNRKMHAARHSSQSPGLSLDEEVVEQLRTLQELIGEANWQARSEAVIQVTALINSHKTLRYSSQLVLAVDILSKGLLDKNANVVFKALDSLQSLSVSDVKISLIPHSGGLVQALVGALSSGNSGVRSSARQVLSHLVREWEAGALISPLVSAMAKATDRAKAYLVEEMLQIVQKLKDSQPALITRVVVPAAKSLMSDSKPELKAQADRLLKSLYDLLGSELLNSLNQEQLPRLMEVLENY